LGYEQSGSIISSLTEGLDALQGYYGRYLPAMTTTVFLPLGILVLVFPVDSISGIVMAVTAPLIPLFMVLIGKGAESLSQRQWKKMSFMAGYFLDVIRGLTTLKLFNASRREAEMIGRVCEEYRRDTMAVLRIAFLSSLTLEFFATVSIAIVAVLIGFRLLWGQISFQQGFFVLLIAPEFYLPLRRMGVYYHARMDAIGAAEKIAALVAYPPLANASQAEMPAGIKMRIRFDHVSFSYEDGRPALDDVCFLIKEEQSAALVGPSGSGKSTILALLLGFIEPQSGQIFINDVPLQSISKDEWWASMGWIPQNPTLFSGTVENNIRMAYPAASNEEIQDCARRAQIDFLARLVGEKGRGLSGGQIQRVAIARALIRKPRLLLLDEPTACLDAITETLVDNALAEYSQGHTAITVAHRLHTIQQSDIIIVLDRGKIVAQGTHEELAAQSSYYRSCLPASMEDA
jgi:ATP-binding cassette, subfamily C, bacterial CydD